MTEHSAKQTTFHTIASAVVVLFIIQLFTIWMESIYRLGLIHTSAGSNLFYLLFVLVPLIALVWPGDHSETLFRAAIVTVLGARLACLLFGVRGCGVAAGLGVGASLILTCFVLSTQHRKSGATIVSAVGLGVLMSVALRSLGSTNDITFDGRGTLGAVVLGLAVTAAFFWGDWESDAESAPEPSLLDNLLGAVGLFANGAIVYLIVSSPGVISAWSGSDYLRNIIVVVVAWAVVLGYSRIAIPRVALIIWNVAFIACLLGGIMLHSSVGFTSPDERYSLCMSECNGSSRHARYGYTSSKLLRTYSWVHSSAPRSVFETMR